MSREQRIAAFTVMVLLVAGGFVAVRTLVPSGAEQPPASAATPAPAARPTIQDGTRPTPTPTPDATQDDASATAPAPTPAGEADAAETDPSGEDLPVGAEPPPAVIRETAAAEQAARGFLAPFLRYEVGDVTPAVEAALRRRAEPGLAATLLAEPPRVTAGVAPQRATLVRVDSVEPAGDGDGFDVICLVERAGLRSPLTVGVERRQGRWLATAVG